MKKQILLLTGLVFIASAILGQKNQMDYYQKKINILESLKNIEDINFETLTETKELNGAGEFPQIENDWNLDSIYSFDWINNDHWLANKKDLRDYDADGNIISSINYTYNAAQEQFINSGKAEFSYDAAGNRISGKTYEWDPVYEEWDPIMNELIVYVDGKETEINRFLWNDSANTWVLNWRYEYFYFDAENKKELISYNRDEVSGLLVQSEKDVWTYENGLLVEMVRYFNLSGIVDDWSPDSKNLRFYNSNDNITEAYDYAWDFGLNDWKVLSRIEYNYDASKNYLSSVYKFKWEIASNDWTPQWKDDFFWDNDNNIGDIFYFWNTIDEKWDGYLKTELEYDDNHNNIVDVNFLWDADSNNWIESQRYEYYYSAVVTGIDIVEASGSFKLYPNPTSGYLNLVFEDATSNFMVELYNVNGQKLYSRQFEVSSTLYSINLPEIPEGIYFIKIQGEGFVKTEKLMVKR